MIFLVPSCQRKRLMISIVPLLCIAFLLPVLAKLAESYVESICSGKVPCMENAVLALAEMENSAALGQASARYVELMEKKLKLPTETTQQLLEIHAECEKEALRVFMDRSFKDDTRHFQAKLMVGFLLRCPH